LTTPVERREIVAYAESRIATLPPDDLEVLGFRQWLEALGRGISAHHAGMLPVFKECVEELFSRGLVKMVFATETLALGINMPARSVVIDRLSKWNGETHAEVTPGEYTQLTGRAGRRGIDVEGHAVVLWSPGLDPKAVAGLASTRTYPLRSSFRPSYNMAVNLVQQVGKEPARELLESSFAQFQADRAVVGLAREVRKAEEGLAGYRKGAACERGDFMEYAAIRRQLSDLEAAQSRRRRGDEREAAAESLLQLKVGDVIKVPAGRWAGVALVLDPGVRSARDGPRPFVLTIDRQARRLSLVDFPTPAEIVLRLKIPKSFNAKSPQHRRELAVVLRDRTRDLPALQGRSRAERDQASADPRIHDLRTAIRAHPCHGCPDREQHARWAERYLRLERETNAMRRRIEQRTNTIAREFDRVCEVLDELGYLEGNVVTTSGRALSRIYSELDLLVAECLRRDIWRGLEGPALAAVLSALVFESRKPDEWQRPRVPGGAVRSTLETMTHIWSELDAVERAHSVSFLREPDVGFAWAAYRWAGGAELDDVLADVELAAGDFVRWVKQVLDLADQVADAATDPDLRATLRDLTQSMRRGVVAYSADVD
jgi:ATP-dependent RNA helicase HelY